MDISVRYMAKKSDEIHKKIAMIRPTSMVLRFCHISKTTPDPIPNISPIRVAKMLHRHKIGDHSFIRSRIFFIFFVHFSFFLF